MFVLSRRKLVQGGAAVAAAATVGHALSEAAVPDHSDTVVLHPNPISTGTPIPSAPPRQRLNAMNIPQFEDDMIIPPVMPPASSDDETDSYEIAIRQVEQQMLPTSLGLATPVWAYGPTQDEASFHSPSCTIEAKVGHKVRVTWRNELVDEAGNFLPHLLPVDPTLHWAHPDGGEAQRDQHRVYHTGQEPELYTGPVPTVTHLHGVHVTEESDGYPTSWTLPAANNTPDGYALVGSTWERHAKQSSERNSAEWTPASTVSVYPNDQPASTLWFHDHTLGITRLNVYAGLAGFYIVRGGDYDLEEGVLPGPAPALDDTPGTRYYEIPLAIQDRSFNADGSLYYPETRAMFDGFEGPYVPMSDISPAYNPEVFGDTITVNGKTWPKLSVEPRRYRFRILNGCNSRFIILKIANSEHEPRPITNHVPMYQIGTDVSFLKKPELLGGLLLGPAERADVIVDFTGVEEGTELYLVNEGPDSPFSGGELVKRNTQASGEAEEEAGAGSYTPATVQTTGQVMKFVVGKLQGKDTSTPVHELVLPQAPDPGPALLVRKLALIEQNSRMIKGVGPMEAMLGIIDENEQAIPKGWEDPITEKPIIGVTELWEFHNSTFDAHTIHIHETMIQVIDRTVMNGTSRDAEPGEQGFKDTFIAYPNEITRVKVRFQNPGTFVWHCHVLEHEDHQMMRPLTVLEG